MEIIRGTTPSIIYKFDIVQPEHITVCYLLIKQKGQTVIEKTLNDAVVTSESITFTLTQQDTLQLITPFTAQIMIDWKTEGGVRGRSEIVEVGVKPSGKDEVI